MNKALEALRAEEPAKAKHHLQLASQVAPSDPDVTYAWGMYYAEINDWANAETYWQKTLLLYPHYPFARAGLAQLALRNGDLPKAIDNLKRAVQTSPSSWHLEERLAEAYFFHQDYDPAEKHAEHAIEMSGDRASLAQLILAKVYLQWLLEGRFKGRTPWKTSGSRRWVRIPRACAGAGVGERRRL